MNASRTCSFAAPRGSIAVPASQGINPKGSKVADFPYTEEQLAIGTAFQARRGNLKVRALAGTGKTTTLDYLAHLRPQDHMTYVAFNRAIAEYAKTKFPSNVTCNTMHAFAYAVMGERFQHRMNGGRVPTHRVVSILGLPERFEFGEFSMRSFQLTGLVSETVKRFCSSDVDAISARFVPKVPGLDTPAARQALSEFILPYAERAWEDLTSLNGQLRFDHSVYLKLWGMGNPVLPGKVILFDEAQDATPLTRSIVERQNAELVVVGDSFQQLYPWMGAIDALEFFDVPDGNDLPLRKSFRFGPDIADVANTILELLGTDLRLEGCGPESRLAHLTDPEAVLCRTNSEAVARLLAAQAAGVRAGLVGGTAAVEALAKAALDLTSGRRTTHPELLAFDNWGQVCDYVESDSSDARDLQVLVKLVNRYGAQNILTAVQQSVPAAYAHLKISTGHKAKGLEWDSVKLAGDFPPPIDEEGNLRRDELMLTYVCVTRAKRFLDPTLIGANYQEAPGGQDWLSAVADMQGREWVYLPASEVPERVVVQRDADAEAQVICDPNDCTKLVFRNTKYDPQLVAAQQGLPKRRFHAEYNGDAKVNTCLASVAALQVAEQFGLTIAQAARDRVAELVPVGR